MSEINFSKGSAAGAIIDAFKNALTKAIDKEDQEVTVVIGFSDSDKAVEIKVTALSYNEFKNEDAEEEIEVSDKGDKFKEFIASQSKKDVSKFKFFVDAILEGDSEIKERLSKDLNIPFDKIQDICRMIKEDLKD